MVVLCNVFWLFDTKSRFFSVIFCATPTAVRLSFIKCVSTSSEASFGVLVVRTKQNVCLCWRGAASAASFFLHPLLLSSHADKFTDRLSCVFSLSLLSQSPFFTRFFRLWKMRVCAKKLREIWCSRGLWYSASAASEAATTGVGEAEVLATLFENYLKRPIWILQIWHFPPIFVLLELTCLVTLFDRNFEDF